MKLLRELSQECEWPRLWSLLTAGSLLLIIVLFIIANAR